MTIKGSDSLIDIWESLRENGRNMEFVMLQKVYGLTVGHRLRDPGSVSSSG